MANGTIRQKNLKCYEWTVQAPMTTSTLVSESFELQERKCNFEFFVGGRNYSGYITSFFYFISNEVLQSPIDISVSVSNRFINFGVQAIKSFKGGNGNKTMIWNKASSEILGSLLTFEVYVYGDISGVDKAVQISSHKDACFSIKSLSRDFSKMFDEGAYHDVEFVCGDQTVKAHKNILCCRSDVFASMLRSDMVEGKTGRVTLQDIDLAIFQQFLKCLYTGILPELTTQSAYQLYEISDKYCTDTLKKQCSNFLTDNLSPENACEILVLSDRHNDKDFKNDVMEYMLKERVPYVGQKWTDFSKTNPILAVEILNLFCQQFRIK